MCRFEGNPITTIRAGLCTTLRGLQTLDASGPAKHLHVIEPGAFATCSQLRSLALWMSDHTLVVQGRGNGSLAGLAKLETLTMTGGESYTTIKNGTFLGLSGLISLSIQGSWLGNGVPSGAFLGLSRLEKLDLSNNYIQYTSAGTFEGLDSLKEANLAGKT